MNYCLPKVNNMNKLEGREIISEIQKSGVKIINLYTDLNLFSQSS